MGFFVSVVGMVIAFLIVKYRRNIVEFTGEFDWTSRYLGGTANALVFLAIFLFFLSFLSLFGEEGNILGGVARFVGGK
jgi:hypothetical protein